MLFLLQIEWVIQFHKLGASCRIFAYLSILFCEALRHLACVTRSELAARNLAGSITTEEIYKSIHVPFPPALPSIIISALEARALFTPFRSTPVPRFSTQRDVQHRSRSKKKLFYNTMKNSFRCVCEIMKNWASIPRTTHRFMFFF